MPNPERAEESGIFNVWAEVRFIGLTALKAAQAGAISTACWFYQTSLLLLQENPWDESSRDVYYDETQQLYMKTAEVLFFQGQSSESLKLLSEVLTHANVPADKSKAWILKSQIECQSGDQLAAIGLSLQA